MLPAPAVFLYRWIDRLWVAADFMHEQDALDDDGRQPSAMASETGRRRQEVAAGFAGVGGDGDGQRGQLRHGAL
jgi:hypothetical protein